MDQLGQDTASSPQSVASVLNELCQGAVQAYRADDQERLGALLVTLQKHAEKFRNSDHIEIADFMVALSALIKGSNLNDAIQGLVEPYRQGLRAVAADLEVEGESEEPAANSETPSEKTSEPESESNAQSQAQSGSQDTAEDAKEEDHWVAALSAEVARMLLERDKDAALRLAENLEGLIGQAGIDPDADAFLRIILDVLHGRPVVQQLIGLQEPYLSAYRSMEALVRGEDPRAGLVERLRHNIEMVAGSDNPEATGGLAAVLASTRAAALAQSDAELQKFIDACAGLIDGHLAMKDARKTEFKSADLDDAWKRILRAWAFVAR